MSRIYIEAEKSARKTLLIAGVGEFKPSLVLEEAGPLPPDGSALRHDGAEHDAGGDADVVGDQGHGRGVLLVVADDLGSVDELVGQPPRAVAGDVDALGAADAVGVLAFYQFHQYGNRWMGIWQVHSCHKK